MNKFKIGDSVILIAGKDKGKIGKITKFVSGKVIVDGCNLAKKSVKADQSNPNGGFINKEMPLSISNVMHYSQEKSKRSRVSIVSKDGKNTRSLKACGTLI
tara:strand:- start:425 stop:727 length:303 start_codon:yes stop_codon:yes gene_type:complete